MTQFAPGIKASFDWRRGAEWTGSDADARDPAAVVRGLGITFVEFGLWSRAYAKCYPADVELRHVLDEASYVVDRGLRAHLHPYVHQDHRGPGYFAGGPDDTVVRHLECTIDAADRIADLQGAETKVVFHPADHPTPDHAHDRDAYRNHLIERTRAFFTYADDYVRRTGAKVRILCENPPPNLRRVRVGEHPWEILHVIDGTTSAVCWDVGHFQMSSVLHRSSDLPDDDFLRRVQHVHLHAVRGDLDHQVPLPSDTYLQRCMTSLTAVASTVTVTLEYPYAAPEADGRGPGGAMEAIERGLAILAAAGQPR